MGIWVIIPPPQEKLKKGQSSRTLGWACSSGVGGQGRGKGLWEHDDNGWMFDRHLLFREARGGESWERGEAVQGMAVDM